MNRKMWLRHRLWKRVRHIEWKLIFAAVVLTVLLVLSMYAWLIAALKEHTYSEEPEPIRIAYIGVPPTEEETTEYAPQLTAPAAGQVRTEAEIILDYLE